MPVLFIIAFALKFIFISNPLPAENPSSGGLLDYYLYSVWWKNINPGLLSALSILILVLSGLYFNYLLNERRMFQRSHLLTALSFVLFTSLFAGVQRMQAGVIMLPFTILLYRQMLKLYNSPNPRTTVLNIGLLAGTGTLLYHPYWWMLPCCFLALGQMRPFRLNEWVLLLLGYIVPAYIILSYEYLTDQWNPKLHWPVWNPMKDWPALNPWWIGAIILSLLWVLPGFAQWQDANRRMLIQTRKNWYLLLLLGVFLIPSLFFPIGNVYEGLTLLLLPASALGGYTFLGDNKRGLKTFFFWVLAGACVLFGWAILQQKM